MPNPPLKMYANVKWLPVSQCVDVDNFIVLSSTSYLHSKPSVFLGYLFNVDFEYQGSSRNQKHTYLYVKQALAEKPDRISDGDIVSYQHACMRSKAYISKQFKFQSLHRYLE